MFKNLLRKTNDRILFTAMGLIVPLFVSLPIIRISINFFKSNSTYYQTLIDSKAIITGVVTTIELIIKVGFISAIIGFILAYIMTFYNIKFKKLINILLILPLTIPVYVAAYTYSNIFHYLPFLETILRSDFMMNGAVFIYALFLYPYVYLACKSYLSKNLTSYIEASRTLGKGRMSTLIRVVLPLSRPVIVGSVLFALFETLSDFAVVEFYGVLTLSRYINLAWFSNGDFTAASKFSVYILLIMLFFISVERISRGRKKYVDAAASHRTYKKETPSIKEGILIYLVLILIIAVSSVLPISQMVISAFNNLDYISRLELGTIIFNTLMITILSIGIIIFVGILIATITIYLKGYKKHVLSGISTIGYVVPSMVLALGIYLVFIRFDQWIYSIFNPYGLDSMLITSSVLILIIAFFIKFFSIAYSNLISAYAKIDMNVLEASETLGENKITTMFRVSLPMMKKSIIAVAIILFIDMSKELTLVYSLRPFNFKTLSTEVYRYAGNEMINIAAFPSLVIIVISTILVVYLEGGFKNDRS